MKYLISTHTYPISTKYKQVTLMEFHKWVEKQTSYELDIETNVVDLITDREIYVVQFGSTTEDVQFVHDVASYPESGIEYIKSVLNDKKQEKIIHNALFEYSVIKHCWGIEIDNIYDTFLMLKVILNGRTVPDGIYTLQGAVKHFLHIEMSKEAQTTFTGGMLSDEQIVYAATDVMHMSALRAVHTSVEYYKFFEKVIELENKVVRILGDIATHGFVFDKDKWIENMEWVTPQIAEAKEEIFSYMRDNLYDSAADLGFIQRDDEVTISWTSPSQRKKVFQELYPELENFTKPALKKFELTIEDDSAIYFYLKRDYKSLNSLLLKDHKAFLVNNEFFIEKGSVSLNLASPKQRLMLFQLIEPSLTSTAADSIANLKHPLFKIYSDYIKKSKLLSSYGEKWFKFIGSDGRMRPGFIDQVLDTGRISVSKPGMMTIPADDYYLKNRYREPFKPTPGWKIVAGDYASQELAIIAILAQEKVWIKAIAEGRDLHSVCANLVYGQKWFDAGGDAECLGKPDAPDAYQLRTNTKTTSFGLAFGGGAGMLANRLNVDMGEARSIIKDYFTTFPTLKKYFAGRAEFGILNGFIYTAPPFYRRRYFSEWTGGYLEPEVAASIERQCKNTPVQGTGADGTKSAMILMKEYIEDNGLSDRVRILFMLHDAIICEAREDYAEEWAPIHKRLMEEGHEVNMPKGFLAAEVGITDTWTK
jgi:DNA polymerase I-like protein with 3'-5' exonuclease and polymerase domains